MNQDGQEVMNIDSGTIAILNKSEIEQQIATAHKFPRSIKRFRDETMQMVTLTEKIAEECIYSLPRGGKTIDGPSARFAEVVASAWGNSRAGARVTSDQGEFVTAQGVFHDLEKNVAITYEVQRRIVDAKGKRYNADMIGVTANAACSIALRNAILKGVPKAFWSDMYDAARATVLGDFKTLANRRADAIKAFQAYGVLPEQICATLGVAGVEDIGLENLLTLRGLLTAIKEGDTTPEQAFAPNNSATPAPTMPQSKAQAQAASEAAGGSVQQGQAEIKVNSPPFTADGTVTGSGAPAPAPAPTPAPADTKAPAIDKANVKPCTQGQIDYLESKMDSSGRGYPQIKEKFGYDKDQINAGNYNAVLAFIKG